MRTVRLATEADAAGILAVYAPYIRDTAVTFETETPSLDAFRCRMASIIGDYPYLVVEEDGSIVGFAYAHRLGERAAYAWNAELSIYFCLLYTSSSPKSVETMLARRWMPARMSVGCLEMRILSGEDVYKRPLLFGAGCLLMPQSTCIFVAFLCALLLGVDLSCFFPLFFDGGFKALALAHRLFVSSRLNLSLIYI